MKKNFPILVPVSAFDLGSRQRCNFLLGVCSLFLAVTAIAASSPPPEGATPATKAPVQLRFAALRVADVLQKYPAARQLDEQAQARLAEMRRQVARKQEVRALLVAQFPVLQDEVARLAEKKDETALKAARERLDRLGTTVQDSDREIAALANDPSLANWVREEQRRIGDQVRAAAQKLAARHGCHVVLDVSLNSTAGIGAIVLVEGAGRSDDLVDITDEVVAELGNPVAAGAAPAPPKS